MRRTIRRYLGVLFRRDSDKVCLGFSDVIEPGDTEERECV